MFENKYLIRKEGQPDRLLKICPDECPQNPREWDNLSTIYTWHREYKIGDEVPDDLSPWNTIAQICEEELQLSDKLDQLLYDNYEQRDCMKAIRMMQDSGVVAIVPISLYDHSGITISAHIDSYPYNDRWDSMIIGFAYITKDKAIKENGFTEENWYEESMKIIYGEIETLDDYISGNVYGYILYDKVVKEEIIYDTYGNIISQTTEDSWNLTDSCWGFYGDAYTVEDLQEIGILDNIPDYDSIEAIADYK